MSKVIMFDIDGVLADFTSGFYALANHHFGTPRRDTETQDSWDFNIPNLHLDFLWGAIRASGDFWYNLTPLVGAQEWAKINWLASRYPVWFVTSRPGNTAFEQTARWLKVYTGILYPRVITSFPARKGEIASILNATHAIDDKAENAWCVAWLSPNTKSYLLDRLYNRYPTTVGANAVKRISSVDEFLLAVEA